MKSIVLMEAACNRRRSELDDIPADQPIETTLISRLRSHGSTFSRGRWKCARAQEWISDMAGKTFLDENRS